MSTTPARTLDTQELEQRVKHMYQEVALQPEREFHFETGRVLAERLGYPPADLDRIPAAAIDSFAGVGHFLDLADIAPGDTVLDLGDPPVEADSVDCVISNGVINLSPDKAAVFAAVANALRPGGRLALADIVSTEPLPEGVTCDASLWAACIGGAMQRDRYRDAIEGAGLHIVEWRENPEYRFVSERADNAVRKYGVTSISLLARHPG
jgi:SAM-dependent methyltransferase